MRSIYDPRYLEMIGRLRAAREGRGLTQTELAQRLGKSQAIISKIERGQRRLDYIEVVDICAAIGVRVADIIPENYPDPL